VAESAAIAQLLAASPPRVGPFRLVAALGEGGFAPVFLAAEEYGGVELRTVAIKLFAPDSVASSLQSQGARDQARARIIDEARALCRVEHPNVVRFLQLVETPSGVLGLAMDHVRGRSLGDRLDAELRLPLAVALEVGAAVASALAAVHAVGLVHRDVKPGNVIDAGGVYKLIDFGIAARARPTAAAGASMPPAALAARSNRAVDDRIVVVSGDETAAEVIADATLSSERTMRASERRGEGDDDVAGTMGYVDPECLGRGAPADASSDLYALGAMLYECLTGRLPASEGEGEGAARIRMNVAMGLAPAPPVRELAPAVPEAVARLVDSLVAPRRERRPQRAEWVACELERLGRLEGGTARALPDEPFRGLAVFEEAHRDVYFGRATEIASAVELLRWRGLLALVGPSGSGKSSLARAGVLPAVLSGALGVWPPSWRSVILSPGRDPRATLAHALAAVRGSTALPSEPGELASSLASLVEQSGTGLVILVDALEELVTLAAPDDRAYLAAFLAALSARPSPGLRAVVTARRDLVDPLLGVPALGEALTRAVQLVAPLTAQAWVDVVDDRLAAYGYALEDAAMRDALAAELTDASEAMPLVEFALARLWERRDSNRRVLSGAALAAIGGLAGALAQHAETTLAALAARSGPTAATVAADVLLALTTPHGTRATHSRLELASLVPDPLRDAVLAELEAARLVVFDDGATTLAHDALIARWPRLQTWVQSVRREREAARDVEDAAARWRARRDRDLLLRGGPLRDARALLDGPRARLSAEARAFVAASTKSERRATAGVITGASVVLVGLGVLGGLYVRDTRTADRRSEAQKQEAFKVMKVLSAARDEPAAARAAEIENLVVEKHACEKELATCRGDAGAP
jgi:eukaryotic-like serine/threonine-protein kinase